MKYVLDGQAKVAFCTMVLFAGATAGTARALRNRQKHERSHDSDTHIKRVSRASYLVRPGTKPGNFRLYSWSSPEFTCNLTQLPTWHV